MPGFRQGGTHFPYSYYLICKCKSSCHLLRPLRMFFLYILFFWYIRSRMSSTWPLFEEEADGHGFSQTGSIHLRAAFFMYFFSTMSKGRITVSFPLKKDSLADSPSTLPVWVRFMKKVAARSSELCPKARWVKLYFLHRLKSIFLLCQEQIKHGDFVFSG